MTSDQPFSRLSISLPVGLMEELDRMVAERALPSRSALIVELIRNALADYEQHRSEPAVVAGTITLVYRAQSGAVRNKIAQTQRQFVREVVSSQHVFLEDDKSLEVLLVQGPPSRLSALTDELRKVRGVQQIRFVATTSLLPPLHEIESPRLVERVTP